MIFWQSRWCCNRNQNQHPAKALFDNTLPLFLLFSLFKTKTLTNNQKHNIPNYFHFYVTSEHFELKTTFTFMSHQNTSSNKNKKHPLQKISKWSYVSG
jgi:hypothetical protein